MVKTTSISAAIWVVLLGVSALANTAATSNLMVNGNFYDPNGPLYGWHYKYDLPGESWYFSNHEHVSVGAEPSHPHVLKLWGDYDILFNTGQGTKVDSAPIPVKPGVRYKFSVSAKSDGPNCRIMIEGYRWLPGIKPHADPELHELRKCYKFSQLYFGSKKEGEMGGVGRTWSRASQVLPESKVSKLARESLDQIKFYVVHIIAIGTLWGKEGTLCIEDVRVEEVR